MHRAAQALVGRHDFSAYRAAGCQASTATRDITSLSVTRDKDWVRLQVTANAFLQHMVRNITGTLVAIGCGDESEEWIAEVLQGRDRKAGGTAAPAHGLTLVDVEYPGAFMAVPATGCSQTYHGYDSPMSWLEKLMPSRISTEKRAQVGA